MIRSRLRFLRQAVVGALRVALLGEDEFFRRATRIRIWLFDAPADDADADEDTGFLLGEIEIAEPEAGPAIEVDIPPGCFWSPGDTGKA